MVSLNSGSLLMLDTTLHPMPSIPLSLACLEGNYVFKCCCKHTASIDVDVYNLDYMHSHYNTYNSTLPVQQCQEKSMPSLKRGNLKPPKQYYHKSLNKVVFFIHVNSCYYKDVHVDLKVAEVAHDNAASVKNYITEDLHLLNSYDTWHGGLTDFPILLMVISVLYLGTKNVSKSMKKIS